MVQITGQEIPGHERERERSRPNPVTSPNPNYFNAGAPLIPVSYYKAAPPIQTLNNYAIAAPPPPPPLPLPAMFPQGCILGSCYPTPIPRSYQPMSLSNEISYPSMYFENSQGWGNPYQQGVAYAPPVQPDRTNTSTAVCSLHGKRRTLIYLKQNERGAWVCTSASVCKVVPVSSTALCSIHRKRRSLQNLIKNIAGEYVCESHDRCIVVSDTAGNKQICSVHGKMRSIVHLVQTSPGVFVCRTGSVCF